MRISLLIVTRDKFTPADNGIFNLKDDNLDYEILIAEGNNPSYQRNKLASVASGDYLLFLDDDSIPIKTLLLEYYSTLKLYPKADIIGGPSVLKIDNNSISKLSGLFFSSTFGIGPVKSRYNSTGEIRKAFEKDLILCNLLVNKAFFLKTLGFDENYYPGEENAFIKSLHRETCILYNPETVVYRRPRETIFLFLKQMLSYGKGRAKHLELTRFFEYLLLVPLFFAIYILTLPVLIKISGFFVVPLLIHFISSAIVVFLTKNINFSFGQKISLPVFFFLGHFSYGAGLLIGIVNYKLIRKLKPNHKIKKEVTIHVLKKFKKSST